MPSLTYFLFLFFTGAICVWVNYYFTSGFWWFRDFGYAQSFQSYGYQVLIYCASLSASLLPVLALMAGFAWLNRSIVIPAGPSVSWLVLLSLFSPVFYFSLRWKNAS